MNFRTLFIMTTCMISSVACAMQERKIHPVVVSDRRVWQEKLAAFRAKNPSKIVIINGVLYRDPLSPEAVSARDAWRQRTLAIRQERRERRERARQRQRELRLQDLMRERAAIASRALRPRSINIPLNTSHDTRTQLSLDPSNKENLS